MLARAEGLLEERLPEVHKHVDDVVQAMREAADDAADGVHRPRRNPIRRRNPVVLPDETAPVLGAPGVTAGEVLGLMTMLERMGLLPYKP